MTLTLELDQPAIGAIARKRVQVRYELEPLKDLMKQVDNVLDKILEELELKISPELASNTMWINKESDE